MEQLTFDNVNKPLYKVSPNEKIRLIELFAGIGAQAKSLDNLNANYEKYKISEWEVNAVKSYRAIHYPNVSQEIDYTKDMTKDELVNVLFNFGISSNGKDPLTKEQISKKNIDWLKSVYNDFIVTHNVGSVSNIKGEDLGIVDTDEYTYIACYSYPCQDLSIAGKLAGMDRNSGTRSSLLWEVERLLFECNEKYGKQGLPQILLMENVKRVISKKNMDNFKDWCNSLEKLGYSNYYQVLDAQDYGIPQHRERCFMVSILGDYSYEFPKPFELELRLKDMLEENVDEKYYLSDAMMDNLTNIEEGNSYNE